MVRKILLQKDGYSLMEGIIALALTAVGMVVVVSLLGLHLEAAHRSEILLKEATEISSLRDSLKSELEQQPIVISETISTFLENKFPDYRLVKCELIVARKNCWKIEIENKLKTENHFYFVIYKGDTSKL